MYLSLFHNDLKQFLELKNINSNINVSGGSILGHAVNGEINVLPGAVVTASGDDVIGIFGDGLKGAGTWTQAYEANNLGTIDFSSSNKAKF